MRFFRRKWEKQLAETLRALSIHAEIDAMDTAFTYVLCKKCGHKQEKHELRAKCETHDSEEISYTETTYSCSKCGSDSKLYVMLDNARYESVMEKRHPKIPVDLTPPNEYESHFCYHSPYDKGYCQYCGSLGSPYGPD